MKKRILKLQLDLGGLPLCWDATIIIGPKTDKDDIIPIVKWMHIFCNKWSDTSHLNYFNI